MMANGEWCVNYNGRINASCLAGVAYAGVEAPNAGQGLAARLPCFETLASLQIHCNERRFLTPAERRRREDEVARELNRWSDDLKAGRCPNCGTGDITQRQVGRCVYGSCGCRLYQGTLGTGP